MSYNVTRLRRYAEKNGVNLMQKGDVFQVFLKPEYQHVDNSFVETMDFNEAYQAVCEYKEKLRRERSDVLLDFIKTDGGRRHYFKGESGDCVTRSIVLATGRDYKRVYDDLKQRIKKRAENPRTKYDPRVKSPRDGVPRKVYEPYILEECGMKWEPTMEIGKGCQVHMRRDELPPGQLICRLSRHLTCVVKHTILDTHDPSRNGNRCVYGYYYLPR